MPEEAALEPAETDDEELEECDCPHLDPADWHEVESDWSDIAFLKSAVPAVLGVPTSFITVKWKLVEQAEALGATVPDSPMVLLGAGQFRRPVLLEVEDPPEGAKGIVHPGGVAFSHLVPAPLGEMKKRLKDLESAAREKYGRKPDEVWLWYLTCRVCSRERNFETLIVAHYEEP